jgi:hypothetical protein
MKTNGVYGVYELTCHRVRSPEGPSTRQPTDDVSVTVLRVIGHLLAQIGHRSGADFIDSCRTTIRTV